MAVVGNEPPVNGTPATTCRHRVAIVGAGFAGLFAAKALRRADVEVRRRLFAPDPEVGEHADYQFVGFP